MCNLTNHTYFTLGENSLDKLRLKLPSKEYVETTKEDLLPKCKRYSKYCINFDYFKNITSRIDDEYLQNHRSKGYDHYMFFLEENRNDKINLHNSKYLLSIETDYEGAQIYSDNYEDNVKCFNTDALTHRGIAIEPSKSILDLNQLNVGEEYRHFILYKFQKMN